MWRLMSICGLDMIQNYWKLSGTRYKCLRFAASLSIRGRHICSNTQRCVSYENLEHALHIEPMRGIISRPQRMKSSCVRKLIRWSRGRGTRHEINRCLYGVNSTTSRFHRLFMTVARYELAVNVIDKFVAELHPQPLKYKVRAGVIRLKFNFPRGALESRPRNSGTRTETATVCPSRGAWWFSRDTRKIKYATPHAKISDIHGKEQRKKQSARR